MSRKSEEYQYYSPYQTPRSREGWVRACVVLAFILFVAGTIVSGTNGSVAAILMVAALVMGGTAALIHRP